MANFDKIAGPITLGAFNIAAAGAVAAMLPLIAEIQFQISFLGSLKADLLAQFNAAVSFQVNFSDPIAAIINAIKASLQVIASLQASLALGIPPLSIQISASVNIAAAVLVQLGLINAAIDAALAIIGVPFLAELEAALSAGPVVAYGWSGVPMATALAEINGYPNYGADGFSPATPTYGVMVVTGAPSAFVGMQFLFLTR